MAPRISVIAEFESAAGIAPVIAALDSQTYPPEQFEVVVLVAGSDADTYRRLTDWAARRPNATVVAGATLGEGVQRAAGTWVLVLDASLTKAEAKLLPRALEVLASRVEATSADIVVARSDAPRLVNDVFAGGPSVTLPAEGLLAPFVVLYRTEFAERVGIPADVESAGRVLAAAQGTEIVADYPCVLMPAGAVQAGQRELSVEDTSAEWKDGSLVVRVSGSGAHPDGSVRVSIRRASGERHLLLDDEAAISPDGAFSLITTIDPLTAACGAPLDRGKWEVCVGGHHPGAGWSAHVPLRHGALPPAIVNGVLIAPTSEGTLALDVGATQSSVIPPFGPNAVRITDVAAGVEMSVRMPEVHVFGDSVTDGFVYVGDFPLRARLVVAEGVATLRCWLSGMAGTAALSTRFGTSAAASTGLSLRIDPIGTMSVIPTPSTPASAKQVQPAQEAESRRAPGSAPLMTRARRRVPRALEPAVRAFSRNETARRVYRRLGGGG